MGAAHTGPWPTFGWRDLPPGRVLIERMRMAAERGGGRGRFRGRGGPGPGALWGHRGGGPFGFGSGPKVGRGDVRASVLALLAEEPRNGYQIMQEIEERSGGVWRPSAGSVYPALQQLEDEGLVRAVQTGARRVFELTDEGRKHVGEHSDGQAAPWEAVSDSVGDQAIELRELTREVAMAAVQVVHAGSAAQAAEARRILTDARRSLYRILAEDDPDDVEN